MNARLFHGAIFSGVILITTGLGTQEAKPAEPPVEFPKLETFEPLWKRSIFSTKDLILGGVFMLSALTVGGTIYLLGRLGVDEPYRLVLADVGLVILVTGVAGQLTLIAERRRVPTR